MYFSKLKQTTILEVQAEGVNMKDLHIEDSAEISENTMLAFKSSRSGCYGIELDVQLTKDDEI